MAKSFIVGRRDGRFLIFTPHKYDAATGELIGVSNCGQPVRLRLGSILTEHQPQQLEWEEEKETFSQGAQVN